MLWPTKTGGIGFLAISERMLDHSHKQLTKLATSCMTTFKEILKESFKILAPMMSAPYSLRSLKTWGRPQRELQILYLTLLTNLETLFKVKETKSLINSHKLLLPLLLQQKHSCSLRSFSNKTFVQKSLKLSSTAEFSKLFLNKMLNQMKDPSVAAFRRQQG